MKSYTWAVACGYINVLSVVVGWKQIKSDSMNETERYEMVMERARWLCENSDYLFEKAIEMAEEDLELEGDMNQVW